MLFTLLSFIHSYILIFSNNGYVCFFCFGYKRKYILCLISTLVLSPSLKRWESSVSEILNETVSLSFIFQSRKALRALKGLVKIQALVRGFLVRKRAAATLHSMQALIRAQAAVRSQRARRSITKQNRFRARKSMVKFHFSVLKHILKL